MTNKEDLKQKLWIEVMEDYVLCAEMGHLAIDQAKHKSELRGHLSRLTDFFWNEIEQIRREDKERNNNVLIELNKTLHEQLIDTGLVTLEQWNEEIAPKMSSLHLSIDDAKVSARTFRLNS